MKANCLLWPRAKTIIPNTGIFITKPGRFHLDAAKIYQKISLTFQIYLLILISCTNNYMPNNQFKKGELYSFITGKASTAIARRLQKKFNAAGLNITIEQWSVLYHLWKKEGRSQQELCDATFRDKPS